MFQIENNSLRQRPHHSDTHTNTHETLKCTQIWLWHLDKLFQFVFAELPREFRVNNSTLTASSRLLQPKIEHLQWMFGPKEEPKFKLTVITDDEINWAALKSLLRQRNIENLIQRNSKRAIGWERESERRVDADTLV